MATPLPNNLKMALMTVKGKLEIYNDDDMKWDILSEASDFVEKIQKAASESLAEQMDREMTQQYRDEPIPETFNSFNYRAMIDAVNKMNPYKERAMGFVPPKIPKKKKRQEGVEAMSTSRIFPSIYRGFAGMDVVNAYLLGLGWDGSRGLLVCSPEGYFFGLLYGNFKGQTEITIIKRPESIKRNIEKLAYAGQYWNAILVNSLVAESIPGFIFITPEEIESKADEYWQRFNSMAGDIEASQQSEYSLGETEYTEYMRLKALEKQLQTEKVLKREVQERVKKWEKKAEAERQLIF